MLSIAPQFSTKLLDWYQSRRRVLPWRNEPPDPYRVWVSEIMLQQTTFVTVENRFTDFLKAFPDIATLAKASQADVLRHWAGLGYYARARNLHRCAGVLLQQCDGQIPADLHALRTLPGIGAYTAAAIAAIAFDLPSIAVDSNVKRIYARLSRNLSPIRDSDPNLQHFFRISQQNHSPRHHLQAWMDFGETLCRARHPECTICPAQNLCHGRDIAETLPVKPRKKPRYQLTANAYLLQNTNNALWLRRRPERGLLAGMLEVPTSSWHTEIASHPADIPNLAWQLTGETVHHRFTHIDLHLNILRAQTTDPLNLAAFGTDSQWYPSDKFASLGLPTLMKKIVATLSRR